MLQYKSGFTLIEMMLVVLLMGLIAGLGIPVYQHSQTKNDLATAATITAQSLRRAQILSQGVEGDSTWGVNIQNSKVTIFKGASFATRSSSFDETFNMVPTIQASGLSEVVFAKLTGLPLSTGTITLKINNNAIKNIVINSQGMVSY